MPKLVITIDERDHEALMQIMANAYDEADAAPEMLGDEFEDDPVAATKVVTRLDKAVAKAKRK